MNAENNKIISATTKQSAGKQNDNIIDRIYCNTAIFNILQFWHI